MWWCQFIEWLKFETHPISLRNSGMANRVKVVKTFLKAGVPLEKLDSFPVLLD